MFFTWRYPESCITVFLLFLNVVVCEPVANCTQDEHDRARSSLEGTMLGKPMHLAVASRSMHGTRCSPSVYPLRCKSREHSHLVSGFTTTIARRSGIDARHIASAKDSHYDWNSPEAKSLMAKLEQQAPFLTDPGLLSKEVLYSCPLEYKYASRLDAESTQGEMFYSKMSPGSLVGMMGEINTRLRQLQNFSLQVIRTFKPAPNIFTCRWKVSFDMNGHRTIVDGNSKYSLRAGKVVTITEEWDTNLNEEAQDTLKVLRQSLAFQLARRPPGENEYSVDGFVPGYVYAAWEVLKTFPSVGGQWTRDEIRTISILLLWSCLGVAFATVLKFAKLWLAIRSTRPF
eukprot:gnl/TRDRNA2_/TRDRNA2_156776_c0_seq1.p1 gnl/TRDRNA2_/TRDRNA2_156776_c0~~gnl/TRDRNA2_/TRDRNA2_156776_c0_seq1.p1  ORF type:complete len:343 (+),score=34.29 gnl/TRDRNA2_/TRDRNA2_156776_c0_seq1:95-1123(+)